MKEAIIKYNDAKTYELLKELAKYFEFSISESKTVTKEKKDVSFTVLHVDEEAAKNYRFNRDEANER